MSRDVRGALVLYYSYEIRKPDGRVMRSRRRLAKSFLIAYIDMLAMHIAGLDDTARTDTSGASATIDTNTNLKLDAAAADATYGNVVGTGTNAVTITDSKLQTQISHGSSAGTLQYGACVVNLPSSTSTTTTMIVTRPFSNASGGTVTVKEIGIYATIKKTSGTAIVCIVRDLATIALNNGDVLTLNYTWSTTA